MIIFKNKFIFILFFIDKFINRKDTNNESLKVNLTKIVINIILIFIIKFLLLGFYYIISNFYNKIIELYF